MPEMRHFSFPIFLLAGLLSSSLLSSNSFATTPTSPTEKNAPTDEEPTCELILRGEAIKLLILSPRSSGGTTEYRFTSPKGTLKLPPGNYEVQGVILKEKDLWTWDTSDITLTPQKPYVITFEDFSSKVLVEQIGPFLVFDFKGPIDHQGWTWRISEEVPKFSVSCQGKEIVSGTLEYG